MSCAWAKPAKPHVVEFCESGAKATAWELTSKRVLSEPKIIAELAKVALAPNPHVDWDAWVGDYSRIRDAIEATYPQVFRDFNKRMWQPGGFPRPLGARERKWNTKTGKANFIVPKRLSASADIPEEQRDVLQLTTLRANDQFNTTIYGYNDRYRGVYGTRMVLFISANDMERLGLNEGERVGLAAVADDGVRREVKGLRVTCYDIPEGCCASYYPECNPLIPLWRHAEGSHVPAAKAVPVRVVKYAGS